MFLKGRLFLSLGVSLFRAYYGESGPKESSGDRSSMTRKVDAVRPLGNFLIAVVTLHSFQHWEFAYNLRLSGWPASAHTCNLLDLSALPRPCTTSPQLAVPLVSSPLNRYKFVVNLAGTKHER